MKQINRFLVIASVTLCAFMASALFLARFAHLTGGFQYDELYSSVTAMPSLPFWVIWKDMLLQDVNLPLFNILLYGWNHIFPYNLFWMHLFSAFLGACAVVAGIFLAPAGWPRLKRFLFAVLLAGTPILVIYGTNIRAYSLSVLLSTCFTLLALRLIGHFEKQEAPSRALWLWFFVTGLAGAYSHYFCAGVFFIAALVVFLYACYYRVGRAWSFWGTAIVFACWVPWVFNALSIMGGALGGEEWWYSKPLAGASFQILTFLFGPEYIPVGLVCVGVLGGVSLVATYKLKIFKQADIILPLAQLVLLCVTVAVVSPRFNLWMDRYFLPALPAVLLLFAGLFYHLYEQHKSLLVLPAVLLVCWGQWYLKADYVWAQEFTGLREAFNYINDSPDITRVLLDAKGMAYPPKALELMLQHYIRPGKQLEFIPLNAQTAPLAWQSSPKVPVLMLLCSQLRFIYTSLETDLEEDGRPFIFGHDTCLFTAHKVVPKKKDVAAQKEQK